MFDPFKQMIWEQLRNKEVSLAMVYDREGRILWHRGRDVVGRTVASASGFPKSLVESTIDQGLALEQDNVVMQSSGEDLTSSARMLRLRSLMVLPLGRSLFLYLDSGVRESFTASDREVFRSLGSLLAEAVGRFEAGNFGAFSGSSPFARSLRERIISYAVEDEPVLLTGETGVGKNRAAEAIHGLSGRAGQLVTIHVPSVPENLFESELFGHAKGAFSGAGQEKKGLVAAAEGGTIFLDEIAEVPLSFQAKLLRFADTRRFRPVGDNQERTADVRIIAATNRDLAEEAKAGRFRQDLYFRLNVLPLEILPLSKRREDLRAIIEENRSLLRGKELAPEALQSMMVYEWPGNARQVLHVLTRAGIDCQGPVIGREIEFLWTGGKGEGGTTGTPGIEIPEGSNFWGTVWQKFLDRELNRCELQAFLLEKFQGCNGSLKELAKRLNIKEEEYPRFVSMLHKYKVHPKK